MSEPTAVELAQTRVNAAEVRLIAARLDVRSRAIYEIDPAIAEIEAAAIKHVGAYNALISARNVEAIKPNPRDAPLGPKAFLRACREVATHEDDTDHTARWEVKAAYDTPQHKVISLYLTHVKLPSKVCPKCKRDDSHGQECGPARFGVPVEGGVTTGN